MNFPHPLCSCLFVHAHMQRLLKQYNKQYLTYNSFSWHVYVNVVLVYCFVSDEEDTTATNGGHRLPRSLGKQHTHPSFLLSYVASFDLKIVKSYSKMGLYSEQRKEDMVLTQWIPAFLDKSESTRSLLGGSSAVCLSRG